jgi:hypothetical protein
MSSSGKLAQQYAVKGAGLQQVKLRQGCEIGHNNRGKLVTTPGNNTAFIAMVVWAAKEHPRSWVVAEAAGVERHRRFEDEKTAALRLFQLHR